MARSRGDGRPASTRAASNRRAVASRPVEATGIGRRDRAWCTGASYGLLVQVVLGRSGFEPVGDQDPSAAADQLDEIALRVCEVGQSPFRHPWVWDRGKAHGGTERHKPIEACLEIVHGEADMTQA